MVEDEEFQSNDERGHGDVHRYSVRQSASTVRQERSRRERSTSFSEHRHTPYRHRDSNNDDRGRDWFSPPVVAPDTYNGDMIGNNIFRTLKTVPTLETGQKKKRYSLLQQYLMAKHVCFTQACHLLTSGPIGFLFPD